LTGLEPFTEYVFRVRATSSAGGSEWGPLSSFTTGPASPTAPQNLQAQGEHALEREKVGREKVGGGEGEREREGGRAGEGEGNGVIALHSELTCSALCPPLILLCHVYVWM
jgi:hypothetical protein